MRGAIGVAAITGSLVLAACGGQSDDPNLSPRANEGRQAFRSNGCAACHGSSGQGGVGPRLVDLFESDVELTDGSVVVADRHYLRESITDPAARKVAGFNVPMPTNNLDADAVEAIIVYIEELSSK